MNKIQLITWEKDENGDEIIFDIKEGHIDCFFNKKGVTALFERDLRKAAKEGHKIEFRHIEDQGE